MRFRTTIVIAVFAILIQSASVHGQGAASHGIPDPISTTELLRYADRLGLSDEQRQALQPFHDEYRERFRTLREGEIDRFVEEMQKHGGRASIGTQMWDETSGRRNALIAQIRALDEALFTEFETILTGAQRERMPRVRLARQRARMAPIAQTALALMQVTDLSDVALDIEMSASERERIDPFLAQYEQRLTRMIEELPPIVIAVRKELHAAAEAFREAVREDGADREEAMQHMMTQSHESQLRAQEHIMAIRRLGRDTLFNITPQLSDRAAKQLRNRFIGRAYGGNNWNPLRSYVEIRLDSLLDRDDLDDHVRERVAELVMRVWRQNEAIFREALAEVDEHEAQVTVFIRRGWDQDDDSGDLHRRIRERIHAVEDPVLAELVELLPKEAAGAFVQALPHNRRPVGAVVPPPAPPDAEAQAAMEARRSAMEGGVVPAPISASNVAAYRRALEADEEQRALMEEMYAQYTTRIEEAATPARRQIVPFYSPDEGDPAEFVARNAQHRQRAISAIENADRDFFNGLAELFPDRAGAIDRLRLTRERQRYTISPMARMWIRASPRHGTPAHIDLSGLARRLNISTNAVPEADGLFLEYERELTPLLREAYRATLAVSDRGTISLGLFMLRDQSPDGLEEQRAAARQAQQAAERVLAEAEQAVIELNRRAIDDLVAALPERDGGALLAAYRERVFPQVYRDPGAMEEILSRTLQMGDLNSSQRDSIAVLLADYRAEYAALTAQMHEIAERQQSDREGRAAGGEAQPGATARLREQLEKLRHDRQELNARTILSMEGILSETQLARLGPMPDPTRPPMPRFWDH